jgi:hypothetical protein
MLRTYDNGLLFRSFRIDLKFDIVPLSFGKDKCVPRLQAFCQLLDILCAACFPDSSGAVDGTEYYQSQ